MKEYTFEDHLKECLEKDPEFRELWEKGEPKRRRMKFICDVRKKLNLSQKEMTKRCGISQADLSRIENGNANPSLKTLERIADALDCYLDIRLIPKK